MKNIVNGYFVHCHYMGSMIKQSVTVLKVVSSITINKMSQQIIGWLALGGECQPEKESHDVISIYHSN